VLLHTVDEQRFGQPGRLQQRRRHIDDVVELSAHLTLGADLLGPMLFSFNDADLPDRHETQYFEMLGKRGIYHKGWTAVTRHKTPWLLMGEQTPAFDDDVGELYDTSRASPWTSPWPVSSPWWLHELQRLWLVEATRYNVLPPDDDTASRLTSDLAGRPVLIKSNTQLLFSAMGQLSENCVLNIKNKSHAVTAEIEVPETGAEGVIIAQGANIGGWSLNAKNGKLKYCYNLGVCSTFTRNRRTRYQLARTRSGWNSHMRAAAWARALTWPCMSMAARSARGRSQRRWRSFTRPTTA